MKKKPRVLFPLRLNSRAPVQTIHKKIARYLEDTYSFVALKGCMCDRAPNIDSKAINFCSDWPIYRKALQLLRLYYPQYNILHTSLSSQKNPRLLVRFADLRGARHIHTHHTTTPGNYQQQRWLANHADVVTAVSPFVANWSKNSFGTSEIKTIPNGVDTVLFHPDQAATGEKRALFVGRVAERKHPEIVTELAENLSDWEFRVRLNGGKFDTVQNNMTTLPHLSDLELAKEYAAATALLCPFEREGFGMVTIEAMAAGTPVIGLDDGNLSTLLSDTDGGILCDTLEIHEWSNVLTSINTGERAAAARKKAIEYEWETVVSMYERIYRQIISE